MKQNGIGETINDFLNYAKQKNIQIYPVPYMELLTQIGEKLKIEKVSALQKMINVLSIGVSFALLKYDRKLVEDAIKATFHEKIVEMNLEAVNAAYDYAEKNFSAANFKHKLEKKEIRTENFSDWKPSCRHGQSPRRMQSPNILPNNARR